VTVPEADLDRLMLVMEAAFDPAYGEAWNRRQVEDSLLIGRSHYKLVGKNGLPPESGEEAAGFYLSREGYLEEELLLLAVIPQARRRGLGKILLQDLSKQAQSRGAERMFLEMRRGNPAESLYRNFGFEPIGVRPRYYRGPEGVRIDAITFAIQF